jgi:flagellar biosynthesis chaperone FliJ
MTTFRFRLQRVLDFRRTQFQVAESECQRAAAKLHAIQAQQAALASRRSQTRTAFAQLPEVWADKTTDHLVRLERAAAQELQKRRDALVEAQRKVRLLEKLHDHRKAQWQSDFDRETEELAADSFRPARPSPRSLSHPSTGSAAPETYK